LSAPAAYLFLGNDEERSLRIAMENLLVQRALSGGSPCAVAADGFPFISEPVKASGKTWYSKVFSHFTASGIPAVRLADLIRLLSDSRKRRRLVSEQTPFSEVFLCASAIPDAGTLHSVEAATVFLRKEPASASWLFETARELLDVNQALPISLVTMNAAHLEEAGVFFHTVREEVLSLFQQKPDIRFAGYFNFEEEYLDRSLRARKSLVELFPGSPLHGLVKYVLKAILPPKAAEPKESFFQRLANHLDAEKESHRFI